MYLPGRSLTKVEKHWIKAPVYYRPVHVVFGDRGSTLVNVLCYKSQLVSLDFSLT